ncbi:MAG: hypothetical protein GF311_05735 [Candidatus Lokiarchaeota archaeon]|nr:hypothetical protein [Candidatus Lokiarchaeota archaeon]
MFIEPLLVTIAFIFGATFFIAEFYEPERSYFPVSLIAGISVAYFFLVVLPEISERLPEYPLHLTLLEYLFVLIGFAFIHVSEKVILQRVESKSQKKVRKLMNMENNLEAVEDNIENIVSEELMHEELDEFALRDLARVLKSLHDQGSQIRTDIGDLKVKIHDHITEEFGNLRFFTNFSYHFLIGLILVNLILVDLVSAILFYFFAFFRTVIQNQSSSKYKVFTDLDIEIDMQETRIQKTLLASAALVGMVVDFIVDLVYEINLEVLYILFSFTSGVILYTIVREVLPEKEKGNPIFFLAGVVGFTIIILTINIFVVIL